MGSGVGKPTRARAVTAQMLQRARSPCPGHQAGLPHVGAGPAERRLRRHPETTHEALMWLGWELDRRNQVARASADVEGSVLARVGPWLLIVCKELNMTTNGLRA
jgi:hypothetical protein